MVQCRCCYTIDTNPLIAICLTGLRDCNIYLATRDRFHNRGLLSSAADSQAEKSSEKVLQEQSVTHISSCFATLDGIRES